VEVDPVAAGFDPGRLERIERHLVRRYLEPGKVAGCRVAVARGGHLAWFRSLGSRDLERDRPVTEDTIWRIYSMTKPITGVALMTLYEQGHFRLDDPVSRFFPEWRDLKVKERGPDGEVRLVEPQRPMVVRDLMMHMAGMGYELRTGDSPDLAAAPPEALGFPDITLEDLVRAQAERPLHFHPGTRWLYSTGTDFCGRLVEVISGQRFDDYLRATIFEPLGMVDTGFSVPDDKVERFAANYRRNRAKELRLLDDPEESRFRRPPTFFSGGGGLVSTTSDYLRFAQMMLNGGELDGARVLGRKTVELMTMNHLPGDGRLADVATGYGEVGFAGMGFGLTVAVAGSPAETGIVGSPGEYLWGGAASTIFWNDPIEDLTVVFMVQFMMSGTFDFRGQLKTLVYPAITG
jgi:CubicO group peptidase (beta-lactamase class C family)